MNKHESKYFSTAVLMDEALIQLLDKKDIEYITVKELCFKAGVNRSTFYLHYESIIDLLNEAMEYVNNKFINYFDINSKDFIKNIRYLKLEDLNLITEEYLRPYLEFVRENKKIFKASFNNPKGMKAYEKLGNLEKYVLMPILDRFDIPKDERKYKISFYIHGIMSIIEQWLNEECEKSIDSIEKIIIDCVRPYSY